MPTTARNLTLEHFQWVDGHADVWKIFRNAEALAGVVAGLVEPFQDEGVTAVCGIESRGFLLGAAAAIALSVGFVPVRKQAGLFPGEKITRRTAPDYRNLRHELRLQRTSLAAGDRVLMVDDWIETGSQAAAVKAMVEECGSQWGGCSVIVDQSSDDRRLTLGVRSLISAVDLPALDS
jgi:adenine phosphoribosyltransferase